MVALFQSHLLALQSAEHRRLPLGATVVQIKKEGEEIGQAKGKEIGSEARGVTVAQKMIADGFELETVAKYSGLGRKQLQKRKGLKEDD